MLTSVLAFSDSSKNLSQLPSNLQKIIDYNYEHATEFLTKVSFFVAFVAGILTFLSPCILPFLPAYFAYTFKEKKNITAMTFVFFTGFSFMFVLFGIIAGLLGEQIINSLHKEQLVMLSGIILITIGLMIAFNIKFNLITKNIAINGRGVRSTFLFGVLFSIGWTACIGPVLAGILTIGAILNNVVYSALLLFAYSLGIFVPFFIMSLLYDKLNFSNLRIMRVKALKLRLLGKTRYLNWSNLISGLIFVLIGLAFIVAKGTSFVNKYDLFNTKPYFYSLQRMFLDWQYAKAFSMIIFTLFSVLLLYYLLGTKKNEENE